MFACVKNEDNVIMYLRAPLERILKTPLHLDIWCMFGQLTSTNIKTHIASIMTYLLR